MSKKIILSKSTKKVIVSKPAKNTQRMQLVPKATVPFKKAPYTC